MFKSVISVVKCVFITQMLCLVKNRHGPTTWGSDEKSRTMRTCLVPRGHHQSSVQEEQDGISYYCDTLCYSVILSCDTISVVKWYNQLVHSWWFYGCGRVPSQKGRHTPYSSCVISRPTDRNYMPGFATTRCLCQKLY